MRVFAISDLHIDYGANAKWVQNLSLHDYKDDVLILAGDVTDIGRVLERCLRALTKRFKRVLFVPGNHDLWVLRESRKKHSLEKFQEVCDIVEASGACMQACRERGISMIPLLAWYDYSFGEPSEELRSAWMDFRACRWPNGFSERNIAAYFASLNGKQGQKAEDKVITCSHFLPRIDLMPGFAPERTRYLYPILGCARLERQLRTYPQIAKVCLQQIKAAARKSKAR